MRSQWWNQQRIERYQVTRLNEILRYATTYVPYYRSMGIGRDRGSAVDWLRRFPVLTKQDVQSLSNRLRSEEYNARDLQTSRTSGSTGEPTTTYFDEYAWSFCKYALKARRVLNAGRPFGQRLLVVTEQDDRSHETLSHASIARHLFATLNLAVENPIAENTRRLLEFRPTMLYGYPSYLGNLGDSMLDATAHPIKVPVVFTSSEILTPSEREHLQRIYGGRVIDVYGSTEFKEIAVQCEFGAYHVNFESVYVESYPHPQAEYPRVLITTLVNKAMPLIRFDIGDHAEIGRGPCACGRKGPLLLQPHGRSAETLRFPGDVAVTPFVLTTAVGAFREIKNYTIVHASPNELRVRVFAQPRLTTQRRAELIESIRLKVPATVEVTIEPLDERLPTGKRISVVRTF